MSMITEQCDRLRTLADIAQDIAENSTDTVKTLREAADTIEAYQNTFEDLRAEIKKQYKWLMQTKHTLHDIDIAFDAIKSNVDKHKVGKENNGGI